MDGFKHGRPLARWINIPGGANTKRTSQGRCQIGQNIGMQIGGDHYKNMGVEPWDVVDTWSLEQRIGFYRGGALKYLMRMGSKDESPREIAKGRHYMTKLLEVLDEQSDYL